MGDHSTVKVLGIMSGTSADGLDLALCLFSLDKEKWEYKFLETTTLPYDNYWKKRLQNAAALNPDQLSLLDREFGEFIGIQARHFMSGSEHDTDLIASHGHTIFHQPEKGITYQAGDGCLIASITGIPTICEFRKKDVELGGQGAPLVPVGDEILFNHFDYCLNLGGFANISFKHNGLRMAYDICPVNIILNELAGCEGMEYDKNGELGRRGNIDEKLLRKLNSLDYYKRAHPKSLGREWLDAFFSPLLAERQIQVSNLLRTVYQHIATLIGRIPGPGKKVLVTGGGAYNDFLIDLIRKETTSELQIPENQLIQYKEAMIFGLLGLLRWRNEINCYASVTGASVDSSTGTVYL